MKDVEKVKIKDVNWKNLNIDTIIGLYFEYKEVINYLMFGGLTTVVNFACYYIFAKVLGIEEVTSSGLSWFFSILFAYITNKIFVFESKTTTVKELIKEIGSFFLARVLSGILCDVGTFAFMVKKLGINDVIAKIITQIMVVIVNYVLSKWIIFKNRKN